jgi:hypothetical protein
MGSLSHQRAKHRLTAALAQRVDDSTPDDCNCYDALLDDLMDNCSAETLDRLAQEFAADPAALDIPE